MLMWTYKPTEQCYTTTDDECSCVIWQTQSGRWACDVQVEDAKIRQGLFATVEDAQTWCEGYVRGLREGDKR